MEIVEFVGDEWKRVRGLVCWLGIPACACRRGEERLLNVLSATVALVICQPSTDWHTFQAAAAPEKKMCANFFFSTLQEDWL